MDIKSSENAVKMPENEAIVDQIQQGRTDLLTQLFSQTERFINGYAVKYWKHLPDSERRIYQIDDFKQCGWPALCDAVKTYKNGSECNFISWLSFYLHKECAAVLGHRYNHTDDADKRIHAAFLNAESLDAVVPGTDDVTWGDTLDDPSALDPFTAVEESIYNQELRTELDRNVAQLPEQQQRVINQYYYQQQTLPAIAEHEACSTAWIATQHKHALRRLKQTALRQTGSFKSALLAFVDYRTNFYHLNAEQAVIERYQTRQWAINHPEKMLTEMNL